MSDIVLMLIAVCIGGTIGFVVGKAKRNKHLDVEFTYKHIK